MKTLLFVSLMFFFYNSAFAQFIEPKATIHSIDNYEYPYNYVEVSEEALPPDFYEQFLQHSKAFQFTPITEARAGELFSRFTRDPRARMKSPGGLCSTRRAYIQKVLRGMNIVSGKLLISCPGKKGRLRLRDRVSGRYYTFSNFHDTNAVLVKTASGNSFRIMDLQFQSTPVSLENYLSQIEAFQRIQPKSDDKNAGICYWKISSPGLTIKGQF